jgi:hypothetical protein
VTRPKQRRLQVDILPPVEVEIDERRVRFVGLNLIDRRVMVEYEVDPPLQRDSPFGPVLLTLHVTDDVDDEAYPTHWEDFPWPTIAPNRVTTRLERRPQAQARRLHIDVLPVETDLPIQPGPQSVELRRIVGFDVELPANHGLPWDAAKAPSPATDDQAPQSGSSATS